MAPGAWLQRSRRSATLRFPIWPTAPETILYTNNFRWGPFPLFLPNQRLHSKKRWIGFGSYANGKIHVDSGAEKAMVQSGKSLLPSGIIKTGGSFVVGNVISVVGCGGGEIARGIVNYSAEEVELIKGRHTDEIEEILGFRTCPEVIHRDNLTITI